MKTHAIIQARGTSTRFPNKVLHTIGNESMLLRVWNRLASCPSIDSGTIAIPATPGNEAVIGHAMIAEMDCYLEFERAENDVLGRYYACVQNSPNMGWDDYIVRITADCPFLDPDTVERVIQASHEAEALASNVHPSRTFPDGLDVECFPVRLLNQWNESYKAESYREHVTLGQYHYKSAEVVAVECTDSQGVEDLYDWRWTVDTEEDLEWINGLGVDLTQSLRPSFRELVTYLKENPEYVQRNSSRNANV